MNVQCLWGVFTLRVDGTWTWEHNPKLKLSKEEQQKQNREMQASYPPTHFLAKFNYDQ